jgi:hypothetical protein
MYRSSSLFLQKQGTNLFLHLHLLHTSRIFKVFALRYGTTLLGNTHQLLWILARQSFGQASTGCKGSRKLQKRLHVEVRTGCHLSLLTVSLEDVWEVEDCALQRKKVMAVWCFVSH